tara:strand:- start:85 stop:537 length:453 start_codon:yes stop_codon:yes gene_type:complete
MQCVTFYIGNVLYGIPILAVREISRFQKITVVQSSENRIEGLINLRGQIITVLNLGKCLEVEPVSHEEASRLIILKTEIELTQEAIDSNIKTCKDGVALLVSKIGDVVDTEDSEVEPAPAHINHEYISGVIKLKNQLLTVLSTEWINNVQ